VASVEGITPRVYNQERSFCNAHHKFHTSSLCGAEIFGSEVRTSTLLVIHMLGETHGAEIARILQRRPSRVKDELDSLHENDQVLQILSPTECVRDRLSRFLFYPNADYSAPQ